MSTLDWWWWWWLLFIVVDDDDESVKFWSSSNYCASAIVGIAFRWPISYTRTLYCTYHTCTAAWLLTHLHQSDDERTNGKPTEIVYSVVRHEGSGRMADVYQYCDSIEWNVPCGGVCVYCVAQNNKIEGHIWCESTENNNIFLWFRSSSAKSWIYFRFFSLIRRILCHVPWIRSHRKRFVKLCCHQFW